MWDPVANRMVGEPVVPAEDATADAGGIWEALDRFTFGTPDLVLLSDGSLLMTYYATQEWHHPRPGLPLPGGVGLEKRKRPVRNVTGPWT